MSTADVVVVGGGIVGVSTAFFLAEAGVSHVLVLEQATVGAGASGRAAGVMLLQGLDEGDLRFQLESIRIHRRFQEELGTDLRPSGSLFLARTPEAASELRAGAAVSAASGIAVETLSPDETQARFPYLAADGIVLGTYSPDDPWAAPLPTVRQIAAAARSRGVEIRERCPVRGIEVEDGRVRRVLTPDGAVAAPIVVNAGGAWARGVGEMAGVRIPVSPRKRQVFVVDPAGAVPADSPFIMEEARDYYCKVRAEGLIMVCGETEGETLDTTVEWGYLDDALGPTERLIPAIRRAPISGAWAGIRPMSPDGRPVLGAVPDLQGYYIAGGFGGQGFTRGPLGGRLIADLITTGRPSVDLGPYAPGRFQHAARSR